ncbi:MAG: hypothetical protein HQ567_09075 [Candidatus Nealsonbacteria bacterium]|nr:hypothetical protein [Candidatus Nealsonbacteria bacterium]
MTTTMLGIGFKSLLLSALLLFVSAAPAQQAAEPPATGGQPQPVPVLTYPTMSPTAPAPNQPAFEPIPWAYERTQANQAGTVSSTHRYRSSEDGNQAYREHVVTDPRREMVQSWERSVTDDGYTYRRQHVWTNPDGTPLRSHDWTTAGTDPNNYERSRTMVLRDGRTLSRTDTRAWDGTQGTREQTMIGPNGQTRTFQRAWAPDGQATGGSWIEGQTPGGQPTFSSTTPLQRQPSAIATQPQPKPSFWNKWNPFAKKAHTDIPTPSTHIASSPSSRRGFTVGSPGRSFATPKLPGVTDRNPGHSQGVARGRSMEHRRIQAMDKMTKTPTIRTVTPPGHSGKVR